MAEWERQVVNKKQFATKAVPEIVNIFKSLKFYPSTRINFTKMYSLKTKNSHAANQKEDKWDKHEWRKEDSFR